jgi:hypothetical protein
VRRADDHERRGLAGLEHANGHDPEAVRRRSAQSRRVIRVGFRDRRHVPAVTGILVPGRRSA